MGQLTYIRMPQSVDVTHALYWVNRIYWLRWGAHWINGWSYMCRTQYIGWVTMIRGVTRLFEVLFNIIASCIQIFGPLS